MSGSGPALFNPSLMAQPALPDTQEIESRFGRITIHPPQAIAFPTGLLGMPNKMNFCLARFPSEKMARFSILQSVQDVATSFITLPVDIDNPIIDREDIEQAAHDLGVPVDDIVVLLIVSVHRETGQVRLSVNARAPVLMRISQRAAVQYVFPHTKYQIRQPLSL